MYLDTLASILQAAQSTLDELQPNQPVIRHLCQVDAREISFPLVAATHSATGPIHRIVLGCDQELAEAVGAQLSGSSEASGKTAKTLCEVQGFRLLCDDIHRALKAKLSPDMVGKRFFNHDSKEFRVRTIGITTFYAAVQTPAGDLHLLVDFARRDSSQIRNFMSSDNNRRGLLIDSGEERQVIYSDRAEMAALMNGMAREAADVLIRSAADNGNDSFLHAMVLADERNPDPEGVTLSSPYLLQSEANCSIGHEVVVVLTYQERLLQFTSTITDLGYLTLNNGALLPVMRLRPPLEMNPGQRRSSCRVVPSTRILGTIHSAAASLPNQNGSRRRELSISVKDLSDTGVRVAMTDQTLLSYFKRNSEVICRLQLPQPLGTIEMRGITQRILLYPNLKHQRKTHLGVEFLPDVEENRTGFAKIRRYVREQQELARREKLSRLPGHLI